MSNESVEKLIDRLFEHRKKEALVEIEQAGPSAIKKIEEELLILRRATKVSLPVDVIDIIAKGGTVLVEEMPVRSVHSQYNSKCQIGRLDLSGFRSTDIEVPGPLCDSNKSTFRVTVIVELLEQEPED